MSDLPEPAGGPRRGPAPLSRPRSKNLLPTLEIDLTKDPADHVLPCSEREQAKHLQWYVEEVRSVNRILGLYEKLPMICPAERCPYADLCPTKPDFLFQGLRCPLEIMEIFRLFVRYIRELEVLPDGHVDLTQIMDLVRIDLQIHRIDQHLQREGMLKDEVAQVVQSTGEAKYKKVSHPLLADQYKLRTQRDNLYKKLIADREARKKTELAEGKKTLDALQLMQQLQQAAMQMGARPLVQIQDSPVPTLSALTAPQPEENDPDFDVLLGGGEG